MFYYIQNIIQNQICMKHLQIIISRKVAISITLMLLNISLKAQINKDYLNSNLGFEERVNILVGQMTLDEKVSQMQDVSVELPRFNIPAYNWWNEGLHGVARADVATVFPQAIGMAATFNDSLLFDVATVISDEFRAKYNEYQRLNDYGRYKGLTVWSPNINIFRDPRWGRGQETYGEDPYLTSRIGVAFVKGLQGNDSVYLKTIATPKHYVVHSGPESLRHVFDVNVSEYDFFDTYVPAFEACVKKGGAYSIMSAYNCFRGESTSASNTLLNQLLRKKWGFKGYVVSDCGAITDVYSTHKIVATPEEAAALAVKSGCDLECGETYSSLKKAVEKKYITEKEIDVALKRLFLARFKLGMFDEFEKVPFNKIPPAVNDCAKHRELSIKTALQTIVLLKNERDLLPLNKNLKTIAVIGPNADDPNVMYGNYNGTPSKYTTILDGIKKQVSPSTKVLYYKACNIVDRKNAIERVAGCFEDGLKTEYFNNENLSGDPVFTKNSEFIDFAIYSSPEKGVQAEHFSVRWTGMLVVPETGNYEFSMKGDDGYRLFIDDNQIISDWTSHIVTTNTYKMQLEKGKKYAFRAEYFNGLYGGQVSLHWMFDDGDPALQTMNAVKDADVIVFVGGLSPTLEGEEMPVDAEGFSGGDRISINLPSIQTEFLKKLKALGKPIVLVLLNGSALAINWEAENIPSIVEAWYPGQEGGTAVADVLFGNYSPAGRLPVTFYKSADQLPPFTDYNMEGRTYRYFKQTPLYPFGFGLSYTTFKYSNLNAPKAARIGENLTISVSVTNKGKTNSDEVVQLYITDNDGAFPKPIRQLKGFRRVFIKAGETKTVTFDLEAQIFSHINSVGERVISPGTYTLSVGGGQPENRRNNNMEQKIQLTSAEVIID